ncbi:DUF6221 family protein [Streptomyces sp. B29(2018)]|uniref:DUF6221 family protein n=1 Tax=Streptomyces sp. B29(2018) TaxID=2485016 RepID=UPI000FD6A841|nr:DUF6221 family protein [Streptomyces sp. B29(2018)]
MSSTPRKSLTAGDVAERLGAGWSHAAGDAAGPGGTRTGLDAFVAERIAEDERSATTDRERKEAAAKRLIISRHRRPAPGSAWAKAAPDCCEGCRFHGEGAGERPVTEDIDECPELRAVASVYDGHPAYERRWAQA